ncbi:NAD(P)-binding Rossmann-fold superfamily protein [Artemisia annua]|uniref:NAD(P)-binding Rossmann-fold superfamily protein n=1 Tax=Artemisia annua TaxID=35608 RepID=A0A2U1QIQ6_ARTAN|nr:NAD(P)-binding Rossmann-fold superfamily protein [Artemisia annua]
MTLEGHHACAKLRSSCHISSTQVLSQNVENSPWRFGKMTTKVVSESSDTKVIKDYIVAFEGGVEHEEPVDANLAKKLHQSEELQVMVLVNYAPIKKKSSTIISNKSDDEMITNKRKWSSVEGQLWPLRSHANEVLFESSSGYALPGTMTVIMSLKSDL